MKLPRPTIARLMVLVAAAGLVFGVLARVDRNLALTLAVMPFWLLTAVLGWSLARRRPRWLAFGYLAATLVAGPWLVRFGLYHEVGVDAVVLLVVALLMFPFTLVAGLALLSEPHRRWVAFACVASAVGVWYVFLLSSWPLEVAFRFARPDLDRLADRLASGGKVATPAKAGAFTIVAAKRDGATGAEVMFLDLTSGFARDDRSATSADAGWFWFRETIKLDDRWSYRSIIVPWGR